MSGTKKLLALFVILLYLVTSGLSNGKKIKKSFLWEIQHGANKSYILGSIHLLKKEMYPLDQTIENAFSESDILVLEVDMSGNNINKISNQILQKGILGDKETLEDMLSKKAYKIIKKKLKKKFNANILLYKKFKPWFLAETIQLVELIKMGFNPQYGIDMHFLNKALGKKEILGLETAEFQLNLLNSLSKEEQEKLLLYTLQELDQLKKTMNHIIKCWLNGDADKIEKFLTESIQKFPEFKQLNKKLLDDRNFTMVEKITDYMKTQKKHFIIVGAAHLVGKKGILQLLIKKGYHIKQL